MLFSLFTECGQANFSDVFESIIIMQQFGQICLNCLKYVQIWKNLTSE